MITTSQVERLVRKIAEAMARPDADTHAAKLAEEYSEIYRAANRRLEQCALMIEAGQSLQALQLAETPPSLLDLITVLNFREAAAWRAHCQSHQLPWTEPFYDKSIRALNGAYGRGVTAEHPFYRDYRRAILRRDDPRALSILRVIAKMNPADENTREELKRVEARILRVKLENLRAALEGGKFPDVAAQIQSIETSGATIPSAHPLWQQAQAVRCHDMILRAQEFRKSDDWQDAEVLVDEIHHLARQYGIQLPAADADAWSELEAWTVKNRTAYAEEKDFQRSLSALEYEIQTLAAQQNRKTRLGAEAAAARLRSLSNKWDDAARYGRPLEESLAMDRRGLQNWLQAEIDAARRRKTILVSIAVILVVSGIIACIPVVREWSRERVIAGQLSRLEQERRMADLQTAVNDVPPEMSARPRLSPVIAQAQTSIAHEKELQQAFDLSLTELRRMAANGFASDLSQIAPRRAETARDLAALAPDFQAEASRQFSAWDAQWQTYRNTALAGQLTAVGQLAAAFNGAAGYPTVVTRLGQAQSILDAAAPLRAEPPALDAGLQSRLAVLQNTIQVWRGHTEHWKKIQAALVTARSFEEFNDHLEELAQSPFATAPQQEAVAQLGRMKISHEALLGELILPEQPDRWESLADAAHWRMALMPEKPTPQEKDLYFKLRDDKNLHDIYVYQLIANPRTNNPFHTHAVFAQGGITMDRGGQMTGPVYDPEIFHDAARYATQTYSDWDYINITRTGTTAASEDYDRLDLGNLIDPNTGNYGKTILGLIDEANADTNSSAIFRAFVILQLARLADLRPAGWGLPWCPAFHEELNALRRIGADNLRSGDWLAPDPVARYEAPLAACLSRASAVPLARQAAFFQQLTQQACQTDFTFAGYLDIDGRPVLGSAAEEVGEFWGWSGASHTAALVLRRQPGGTNFVALNSPAPFTPLYIFNGNRRQLLETAKNAAAYIPAPGTNSLPPLFTGL